MEPWKVILLVAAFPTAGSIALSYMNGEELNQQIANREAAQVRVDNTRADLERTREEVAKTEGETQTLEAETETTTTQLASAKARISELDLKIQTLNDDISAADTKIAQFEELKRRFRDIQNIQMDIASINDDINRLEMQVMNTANILAVNTAKKDETQSEIDKRETDNRNRKAGRIVKDINTQVKAAYNDWGFVIIDAGDIDGLVPAATLDVMRSGKPICKLLITELEPKQAVADIIPGSLLPGQLVQVGDTVFKQAAPN